MVELEGDADGVARPPHSSVSPCALPVTWLTVVASVAAGAAHAITSSTAATHSFME
jgi:hypothetical protein